MLSGPSRTAAFHAQWNHCYIEVDTLDSFWIVSGSMILSPGVPLTCRSLLKSNDGRVRKYETVGLKCTYKTRWGYSEKVIVKGASSIPIQGTNHGPWKI
jgi:hypothetical protein